MTRSTTSLVGWAKALTDWPEVEVLRHRIGHEFTNPALLVQALAHRSWCAEHVTPDQPAPPSNERLEYPRRCRAGRDRRRPRLPVLSRSARGPADRRAQGGRERDGARGRRRSARHRAPRCCSGRGETAAGGREKTSILSDALEAVIAAVYLDGGWEAARRFVLDEMRDDISASVSGFGGSDFKSVLQELAGRRGSVRLGTT